MVDTRSGIREDKLILDIAALEEGSRYARLQFLNPDGKVLKSIDIWQSTDFTIKFELISLDEREIRVKSIPTDPDVWYHMGIASAEDFDRYADWHKFVENLISSDGGGLLAVYVGDEEFSTTCTPGTEYVIYGFALMIRRYDRIYRFSACRPCHCLVITMWMYPLLGRFITGRLWRSFILPFMESMEMLRVCLYLH